MIRISQLKLKTSHTEEEMAQKILRLLGAGRNEIKEIKIRKQSLDARHKPDLFFVYTVDVKTENEQSILKRVKRKRHTEEITLCAEQPYVFPDAGKSEMQSRPVVVGCGPSGLFCAYFLAAYGYRPILIERGAPVEERTMDVEDFWKTGYLKPDSNVQFGEGGAGTFSDGKLNTLVKDPNGRIRKVLQIFTLHGAPDDILYVNKPHVGTDILCGIIRSMREEIIACGGEVHFHTCMDSLVLDDSGKMITGINLRHGSRKWIQETNTLILAPGHSARDTFYSLYNQNVPMEAKSFAVGVRAEHPQAMINRSQYGMTAPDHLPAAAYKLTEKLEDGRGIYSFCMCPGGYVVNASSEDGMLAVNGMSYHARDSRNANSAIVVTVSPEDYGGTHALDGIEFQRKLEKAAFEAGKGKIPVQRYGEFYSSVMGEKTRISSEYDQDFQNHIPCMKGEYSEAELKNIFPEFLSRDLVLGIEKLNTKIRGFSHPDTILSAVESRTSSPVRILRNENMESEIKGLYPCGEGAGYAGGITSAAVDGLKIAETIRRKYAPFDKMTNGLRKI